MSIASEFSYGVGSRMTDNQLPAPFPYPGGKRNAARTVWNALGDPGCYIEPFCGSCAMLLGRPAFSGARHEVVNDADGLLINALRCIKFDPEGIVREAFLPVSEVDMHARAAFLARWKESKPVQLLEGDPNYYDLCAGAYWIYVMCTSIFQPFGGPWNIVGRRLIKTSSTSYGISRAIPCIGSPQMGLLRNMPRMPDESRSDKAVTYLRALQERLERVQITAGDWTRVLSHGVLRRTEGTTGTAVFLDPPYKSAKNKTYRVDSDALASKVLDWCKEQTDSDLMLVIAGYDDDNDELLDYGWRKISSIGGQGNAHSSNPLNGRREKLWLSPQCDLFDIFESRERES